MTPQYDRSDGLSQLTELMQNERDVDDWRTPPRQVDPETRRKRRRRGLIITAIVVVAILGGTGGYVAWALNAPIGAADATSTVPDVTSPAAASISMSPEGESAISVSGADEYLGDTASGIWHTGGASDAIPIASISKLITAMVILSAKPLSGVDDPGPTITFSKADHALYDKYYVLGATIAAMPTGSTMSERDALETMLVPSASNYAEAVAGWAFGSQSGFVNAARQWLADNGMAGTTIHEPTGIDERNTSTPTDMILLGKLAMADPVIAQIAAMPHLDVPNMDPMPNTNDLLGTAGVTGLKTGTLLDVGSDLLFTSTLPVGTTTTAQLTVVGVVLGGFSHESVNLDVQAMLASITAGFHDVPVAQAGQDVGTYSTPWGESAEMVLGESASVFTWSDTPITATMQTTTLTTGADGQQIGTVTWTAGSNTATVPVMLKGTIKPPTAWWRLTHPFELGE